MRKPSTILPYAIFSVIQTFKQVCWIQLNPFFSLQARALVAFAAINSIACVHKLTTITPCVVQKLFSQVHKSAHARLLRPNSFASSSAFRAFEDRSFRLDHRSEMKAHRCSAHKTFSSSALAAITITIIFCGAFLFLCILCLMVSV